MAERRKAQSWMGPVAQAFLISLYATALSAGGAVVVFFAVLIVASYFTDILKQSVGYVELLGFYQLLPAVLVGTATFVLVLKDNRQRALHLAIALAVVLSTIAFLLPLLWPRGSVGMSDMLIYVGLTVLPCIAMGLFHSRLIVLVIRRTQVQGFREALMSPSPIEILMMTCVAYFLLILELSAFQATAGSLTAGVGFAALGFFNRKKQMRRRGDQ